MRNIVANLCVLFVSCLVGLSLCEVSLHLFYPKYRHLAEARLHQNAMRIWARRPYDRNWVDHPETGLRHIVNYNNFALRQGRNFNVADLAAATNIGVFGDSFVENSRMPAPYPFTEPLDYLLNQSGRRFNVLNFGVSGYGPGQSLLHYEHFRYAADLDHVFFVYCDNDLSNINETGIFHLDDTGQLVRSKAIQSAWWIPLIHRLHLSYLILDARGRLPSFIEEMSVDDDRQRQAASEHTRNRRSGLSNEDRKNSLAIFRQLIRHWKHVAELHGSAFSVVTLPWSPGDPRIFDILLEEKVEVINLYDCFQEYDNSHHWTPWNLSSYRFKNDTHWNEAGNQLAAVCLYRVLEERMRLPALSEETLRATLRRYYTTAGGRMPIKENPIDVTAMPGKQIIASDFAVYLDAYRLIYIKEGCSPTDLQKPFFLNIVPVDENDLPEHRVQYVRVPRKAFRYSILHRDICLAEVDLPHYLVRYLWTGQFVRDEGIIWEGEFVGDPEGSRIEGRNLVTVAGERVISSDFDVYLDGQRLIYLKKECRSSDREAEFFLHVTPVTTAALPPHRVQYGFDALDFNACTIERRLPAYPIRHIHTGQYVKDADGRFLHRWNREFAVHPDNVGRRARFTPAASTQITASGFDVCLDGTYILYKRKNCRLADLDASFFLHVTPVNKSDLPKNNLSGFDNLNFSGRNSNFQINEFGCMKERRLPAYPIRHIRTGQYVKDADGRFLHLWEGEFSMKQTAGS